MRSMPQSASPATHAVSDGRPSVAKNVIRMAENDRCLWLCRPVTADRAAKGGRGGTLPPMEIVAARAPAAAATNDSGMARWLPPDPLTVQLIRQAMADRCAVTWSTPRGVGRLVPTYVHEGGLWVFLHVAVSPRTAAWLVASLQGGEPAPWPSTEDTPTGGMPSGVPARADETAEIAAAWSWLTAWDRPPAVGGDKWVDPAQTVHRVASMAALLGVSTVCDACPSERASCYLPRLWEVTVLCLLCLARAVTPERCLAYTLSVADGRLVLRAELPCLIPSKEASAVAALTGLPYLRRVTEASEGILLCTEGEPYLYDRAADPHLLCRRVTVTVTYPRDPAREPWSDFKHPDRHLV